MSFFGSYLSTQATALHDGIVKTVVGFDPEGATEAQLTEYQGKVDELANIAAKAEMQAQADEAKIGTLQASFDQHMKAAASLDGNPDPAVQKGLDKLITDAEHIKGDLDQAKTAAVDSRGYADQMKTAHASAVEKWKSGRQHLAEDQRNMERAKQDAAMAISRKADAERAAGLIGGLDTADVAHSAMQANIAKFKLQSEGARLTTGALSTASEGDDVAAKALAAASGGPSTGSSLADRMAALRG